MEHLAQAECWVFCWREVAVPAEVQKGDRDRSIVLYLVSGLCHRTQVTLNKTPSPLQAGKGLWLPWP